MNSDKRYETEEGNAGALAVSDQGKRILPFVITENAARHFFARFWGREDVYAKRSVNKKSGKAGYADYIIESVLCGYKKSKVPSAKSDKTSGSFL